MLAAGRAVRERVRLHLHAGVALVDRRQGLALDELADRRRQVGLVPEPVAVAQRARLAGADLSGVDLTGANLTDARGLMTDAVAACPDDLEGANLEGASLEGANPEGANPEGANLEGANLAGDILVECNLCWDATQRR